MSIDTSGTIEIKISPGKLIAASVICLLFAMLGAAIGTGYISTDPRAHVRWVGWFCLILFGGCAFFALRRVIVQRGAVVTISPEGIRDIRVAAEVIPWFTIRQIFHWQLRQTRVMVLKVEPAFEHTLTLSRAARWSRKANAALGADGLSISASDLKMGHSALIATSVAYWQAYGKRP